MMMNCEKASTLASAAFDRKLSLVEFLGVWAHRIICAPCRAYRKQLLTLRRHLVRLGDDAAPAAPMDSAAKDRIRARLREFESPSSKK